MLTGTTLSHGWVPTLLSLVLAVFVLVIGFFPLRLCNPGLLYQSCLFTYELSPLDHKLYASRDCVGWFPTLFPSNYMEDMLHVASSP